MAAFEQQWQVEWLRQMPETNQLTKPKIFTFGPYTNNVWRSLLTSVQEYVKHQNGPNLGGKKHLWQFKIRASIHFDKGNG